MDCDLAMTPECIKCCKYCKEKCERECIFSKRNEDCDHEIEHIDED